MVYINQWSKEKNNLIQDLNNALDNNKLGKRFMKKYNLSLYDIKELVEIVKCSQVTTINSNIEKVLSDYNIFHFMRDGDIGWIIADSRFIECYEDFEGVYEHICPNCGKHFYYKAKHYYDKCSDCIRNELT